MAPSPAAKADAKANKRFAYSCLAGEAPALLAGGACLVLASYSNSVAPKLIKRVVDSASSSADPSATRKKAAFAAGVFVAGACASAVRTSLLAGVEARVAERMRSRAFAAALSRDQAEFDSDEGLAAGVLGALAEDVNVAAKLYTSHAVNGLRYTSSVVTSTYGILAVSYKLTGAALAIVPVAALAARVCAPGKKRAAADKRDADLKAAAFANERVHAVSTVKAFAAEGREAARYAALAAAVAAAQARHGAWEGRSMGMTDVATKCSVMAITWYGGTLAQRGEITGGSAVAFPMSCMWLGLGLLGLVRLAGDAGAAKRALARVAAVVRAGADGDAALSEDDAAALEAALLGDVALSGVTFAYAGRPEHEALASVNLSVTAGTTHGVVGSSGAGKSTVAKLLHRLYEPTSGKVTFGGVDAKALDRRRLCARVGVVEQSPTLFDGTVADAIRYGKPDATDAEIREAAEAADAHGFVSALPQGYDTRVGEKGALLSGGQRARVAIARALVSDPPVLVLDEATASLDAKAEAAVLKGLQKPRPSTGAKRTTVVVAHHRSALETADAVSVLKDGKVAKTGKAAAMVEEAF